MTEELTRAGCRRSRQGWPGTGQVRSRQGAQGTSSRRTASGLRKGPVRAGSAAPKRATTSVPTPTAQWSRPMSPPMKASAAAIRPADSCRFSCPVQSNIVGETWLSLAPSAVSSGPPARWTESPSSRLSPRTRSCQCRSGQRLAGLLAPRPRTICGLPPRWIGPRGRRECATPARTRGGPGGRRIRGTAPR